MRSFSNAMKYIRLSVGAIFIALLFSGCGGGGSSSLFSVIPTPPNELYVSNLNNNSIEVFARDADGDIDPSRVLMGNATALHFPRGIAIDSINHEMYVANSGTNAITVYYTTASGNTAPIRTIAGDSTTILFPQSVIVDNINNEIFISSSIQDSIMVFNRTDSGNVAPKRIISGLSTTLAGPIGLSIANNELFVGNYDSDSILVFPRTANGDVTPIRTISGSATTLNAPTGLFVDTVNDEITVANWGGDSILVFDRLLDDGDVIPKNSITGVVSTTLNKPQGIFVDTVNDDIIVGNDGGKSVLVFKRTDTGDIPAIRTISGSTTFIDSPHGVAVVN